MLGPIPDDVICTTYLQGKSERHRNMPKRLEKKLYHMGISSAPPRSTIAYANETRDWRIYADFANYLIQEARPLYVGD